MPQAPAYPEDLIGRLCGKNPEDGNSAGGGDNFPGTVFRDSPWTFSKNNAEIRRAGLGRNGRVLGFASYRRT